MGLGFYQPTFFPRAFSPVDWKPLSKPAFGGRTCPNAKFEP